MNLLRIIYPGYFRDRTYKIYNPNNSFAITIERTALDKVEVTTENFTVDTNGTYYLLKDGTYTSSIPTENTESLYDSTTQKYDLFYEIRVYPKSGTVLIEVANGATIQFSVFDIDKLLESNDTTVAMVAQSMYDILYLKLKEFEEVGLIYFTNFEYGDPIIRYE